MKKLLIAIAAILVSASAFAQGTVAFNNRPPSGDARVSRSDGTGAGAGYTAGLYAGNTLLTPTTTFRTTSAAAAYFVTAVDVAVPGSPGGGSATLRMRAWETAAGSFDAAKASSNFAWGESNEITVTGLGNPAGSPPTPAAPLTGLQGFTVVAVPEPSTIALGVLGAAALLLRRRK